jgi:hypothetical protein
VQFYHTVCFAHGDPRFARADVHEDLVLHPRPLLRVQPSRTQTRFDRTHGARGSGTRAVPDRIQSGWMCSAATACFTDPVARGARPCRGRALRSRFRRSQTPRGARN